MTPLMHFLHDWHPGLCQLTLGGHDVISIDEGPDDGVLELTVDLPADSQDFSVWLVEDLPLPSPGELTLVKAHRVGADHAPIVSTLSALPALAPEPDAPPKPLTGLLVEPGLTLGQALAPAPTPAPHPPLGLVPEHIYKSTVNRTRLLDIAEALHRYAEAGVPALPAWTAELLCRLREEA